jgi:hypothetical protein
MRLQTYVQHSEDSSMNRMKWLERRPQRRKRAPKARPQVEQLETRNLLSSGLTLGPLVPVGEISPALPTPPSSPTVFVNSEVEPQIAVDPNNPLHVVSVWQQDRYRSVGGARAIGAGVSIDGGNTWTNVAPIPYFNATDPLGAAFARYTDPWVTIGANGTVYAAALGLTPSSSLPVPGHTAVLVSTSTDGGLTWNAPATLIDTQAASGTLPVNEANDKEMVVADPKNAKTTYVVWDQLDFPSDTANIEAIHANAPIRENAFFSKTTDGGLTWSTAQNITNFQADTSASGNQLVVEPDGTLLDVCTLFNGSGKQSPHVGQITLAVIRSTDGGNTWSDPITGPAIEEMPVTDPNTGAPVRDGESLLSVAVDHSGGPNNGNLYAIWTDGRFSNFSHDDIAFSVSKDDGKTWSDPIKVNQTPTTIPAGDQQAFTPTVAVNSAGAVAVTYYDLRNNANAPPGSGLPTDYFIAVNPNPVSNPSNWTEAKLTDTSFNMENAAPTSRGEFLGDYQGLAAAGQNFYALFAQAGSSSADPSNIWFRDPPPAPESAAALGANASPAVALASGDVANACAVEALATVGIGSFLGNTPSPEGTKSARASEPRSSVDPHAPMGDNLGPVAKPPASSAGILLSGADMALASDSDALPDTVTSDGDAD